MKKDQTILGDLIPAKVKRIYIGRPKQNILKKSIKPVVGIGVIIIFTLFVVLSSVVYPEVGERILYGKKGQEKKQYLEYSEIIISGNYKCMESASILDDGSLPKFVEEFNKCNTRK